MVVVRVSGGACGVGGGVVYTWRLEVIPCGGWSAMEVAGHSMAVVVMVDVVVVVVVFVVVVVIVYLIVVVEVVVVVVVGVVEMVVAQVVEDCPLGSLVVAVSLNLVV